MLNLKRNTFIVRYKNFIGLEEISDEWGNKTGTYKSQYGELQEERLAISPNKNQITTEMFGTLDNYDRAMTTSNTKCDIDENSILWLEDADVTLPHNYIVTKRAGWKNSIAFAIKKVDVSE